MTYRVPDGVHHREVDAEVVILDASGDNYFSLNASGVVIWRRIADGGTLAEAAADLVATFEISREEAHADAQELVAELLATGLLAET